MDPLYSIDPLNNPSNTANNYPDWKKLLNYNRKDLNYPLELINS